MPTTTSVYPDSALAAPIAIVGVSGLFPKAGDVRRYWQNILNRVDAIQEVPAERWRWFVPGLGVKRYVLLLSLGLMILVVGFTQFARMGPANRFFNSLVITLSEVSRGGRLPLWTLGVGLTTLGAVMVSLGVVGLRGRPDDSQSDIPGVGQARCARVEGAVEVATDGGEGDFSSGG